MAMLVAGVSMASCAQVPAPGGLTNPSFEEWNGSVTGWHVDAKATLKGALDKDTAHAHNGSYALRLSPNDGNTPGQDPLGVGQVVAVDAYEGMEAVLSAWLGADGGATAVVGMHVLNSSGASIDGVQLRQDSSGAGMREHSARLSIPAGASAANLVVFCASEGTAGNAYFDHLALSFEPVVPETPESVSGEPSTIVIHTQDIVRQVPETLFGTNVEWIHNGNDIWDPATGAARPTLVGLTRDLDVTLIRFPGGGFSDAYHWRDGIGDPTTRPTTPHYPTGPSSRHTFGTDEALDFAADVDANLLITVNAGTGTAAEAAEWVTYVNGPNGVSPRRERVSYWEIGNELYMIGDFSGGSIPPAEYGARARTFAGAMRAVDPAIKLGAIGGLNYGRYQVVGYPNWNEEVLKAAGSEIDFLAVHNAYAPVIVEGSGMTPERAYKAMLAAPLLIAGNLKDIAEQIKIAVPERADAIGIAVTEWGPLFHALPTSEWVDHPKTLGSALYVADLLRVFMYEPKVEIANFFKLTEPSFVGWIGPKNNQYIAKAPYLAFQLYREHFASSLVRTQVVCPTYDTLGAGYVAAVQDVPYLSVSASVDAASRRVYLMVVNKHFTLPLEANISLDGIGTVRGGMVRVLSGGSLDAHTGTSLPVIPGIEWARQRSFDPQIPFDSAQLETISIREAPLENASAQFTHTFPPHSVTNIELEYTP